MKIAACIANAVGFELLRFLVTQDQPLQYVVTYSGDPYEDSIIRLCKEHGILCYSGLDVNGSEFISINKSLSIEIVFLLWWPVIIKKRSLESVKRGFINLHPSLLPHNRGMNPYYWSIVDNTPAGVTIHWIDKEIDQGEILFQKRLNVSITETGERLYKRAADAMIKLFCENFEKMLDPTVKSTKPLAINKKVHKVRDMEEHSCIDLDCQYRAGDLIDILRARTFTNGDSAYFYHRKTKYHIRISIEEAGAAEKKIPERIKSNPKRLVHADSKA